jgi:hypothetical protein
MIRQVAEYSITTHQRVGKNSFKPALLAFLLALLLAQFESETEEHKIKPHKLRNLRDHECVLVHCERGFRRVTLPPLEADGANAKWFSIWRRLL